MNEEFENKVVLITGSSSGIGRNTAIAFASFGSHVVINGRSEERINEVFEECWKVSPHKYRPLAVIADLGIESDIQKLFNETINAYKRIDVLVNCASINESGSNIMSEDILDQYEKHYVAKTKAIIRLSNLCAPYLIETKGAIINISSMNSTIPVTIALFSCMTDAAIDSLTKSLALELGPKGVRVNSVKYDSFSPSLIKTPAMRAYFTEEQANHFMDYVASKLPLRKIGSMDDITECILFLASKKSGFITGCNIPVAGGAQLSGLPFDDYFKALSA